MANQFLVLILMLRNKNILENLKFETRPMKFFIKIYLFAIHVLEKGLVFFIIEIDCNSLV